MGCGEIQRGVGCGTEAAGCYNVFDMAIAGDRLAVDCQHEVTILENRSSM